MKLLLFEGCLRNRKNVDFSTAGSFLSGGLDSSYLLALTGVPRAVGVGFRGEAASETPQAAEAARILGADFSGEDISPEEFLDAVPRLVHRTGLPLADASAAARRKPCSAPCRPGSPTRRCSADTGPNSRRAT